MIAELRGMLVRKDAQSVVVDCGGVGYGLSLSLSSLGKLGAEGSTVHVYVYTHVGQDVLRLYGFADASERATFETLIGTTGVGPRLALSVLSAMSPAELATAVQARDKSALTRIPGIGNKTAERLLVELKDRLPEPGVRVQVAKTASVESELVSALVNLGFKEAQAEEVARTARESLPEVRDVAALVRHALRSATRV